MQYCIILNKLSRMWTHRCTPGVLVFLIAQKNCLSRAGFHGWAPKSGRRCTLDFAIPSSSVQRLSSLFSALIIVSFQPINFSMVIFYFWYFLYFLNFDLLLLYFLAKMRTQNLKPYSAPRWFVVFASRLNLIALDSANEPACCRSSDFLSFLSRSPSAVSN